MNLYLKVLARASKKTIEQLVKNSSINVEQGELLALFCDYSEFDIALNHSFKYIVVLPELKKVECVCIVKYAMQAQEQWYDLIPKGHKSLVFFEIDEESRKFLGKLLPSSDGWINNPQKVYFSDGPTVTASNV